jgi:nucleolar pre-ribosomal-associated protein 1
MLLSPFTTVLRIYALSGQTNADNNWKVLLQSIIRECAILKPDTRVSSLDVLVLSLEESQGGKFSDTLYGFLDNCVLRFVKRPVKYYDILTSLAGDNESSQIESRRIDLLLIVILEQWPFLIKASTAPDTVGVAMWLIRYLELSIPAGGNPALLSQIRDKLRNEAKDNDCRAMLSKALKEPGDSGQLGKFENLAPSRCIVRDQDSTALGQPKAFAPPEAPFLSRPPGEDEDHVGLRKWTQKDIQDAIGEGSVGDLIFCLCSKHEDIRKQAQSGLVTFMAKLEVRKISSSQVSSKYYQPSGYSEWQQTYVLAGEVVETAKEMPSKTALPYFAGVIAARSFSILANPLHVMYTKINKFLNKGPQWNVVKLPSYWVDKVLLHPPTDDDAHYEEVRWMLDVLIDGLRTPAVSTLSSLLM